LGIVSPASVKATLGGVTWSGSPTEQGAECWGLAAGPVRLRSGVHPLVVEGVEGGVLVDYVELWDAATSPHAPSNGTGR
jgi:hypothetical protein